MIMKILDMTNQISRSWAERETKAYKKKNKKNFKKF